MCFSLPQDGIKVDVTSRPRGMKYGGLPVSRPGQGNNVKSAVSPLGLAAYYREITHTTIFFDMTFMWIRACLLGLSFYLKQM